LSETIVFSGYYLNKDYEFFHDFIFQSISISVLIWSIYRLWTKSIYVIPLCIVSLLLITLYTFSYFNPRKEVLDIVTVSSSRIYISEYGVHATTQESVIVEKIERCYALFDCNELVGIIPSYQKPTFSISRDRNCVDVSAKNGNGELIIIKACGSE
jgi:Zn-dependent protease with chaperone function